MVLASPEHNKNNSNVHRVTLFPKPNAEALCQILKQKSTVAFNSEVGQEELKAQQNLFLANRQLILQAVWQKERSSPIAEFQDIAFSVYEIDANCPDEIKYKSGNENKLISQYQEGCPFEYLAQRKDLKTDLKNHYNTFLATIISAAFAVKEKLISNNNDVSYFGHVQCRKIVNCLMAGVHFFKPFTFQPVESSAKEAIRRVFLESTLSPGKLYLYVKKDEVDDTQCHMICIEFDHIVQAEADFVYVKDNPHATVYVPVSLTADPVVKESNASAQAHLDAMFNTEELKQRVLPPDQNNTSLFFAPLKSFFYDETARQHLMKALHSPDEKDFKVLKSSVILHDPIFPLMKTKKPQFTQLQFLDDQAHNQVTQVNHDDHLLALRSPSLKSCELKFAALTKRCKSQKAPYLNNTRDMANLLPAVLHAYKTLSNTFESQNDYKTWAKHTRKIAQKSRRFAAYAAQNHTAQQDLKTNVATPITESLYTENGVTRKFNYLLTLRDSITETLAPLKAEEAPEAEEKIMDTQLVRILNRLLNYALFESNFDLLYILGSTQNLGVADTFTSYVMGAKINPKQLCNFRIPFFSVVDGMHHVCLRLEEDVYHNCARLADPGAFSFFCASMSCRNLILRLTTTQLFSPDLERNAPYANFKLLAVQYKKHRGNFIFMFSEGGAWKDPFECGEGNGKEILETIFKSVEMVRVFTFTEEVEQRLPNYRAWKDLQRRFSNPGANIRNVEKALENVFELQTFFSSAKLNNLTQHIASFHMNGRLQTAQTDPDVAYKATDFENTILPNDGAGADDDLFSQEEVKEEEKQLEQRDDSSDLFHSQPDQDSQQQQLVLHPGAAAQQSDDFRRQPFQSQDQYDDFRRQDDFRQQDQQESYYDQDQGDTITFQSRMMQVKRSRPRPMPYTAPQMAMQTTQQEFFERANEMAQQIVAQQMADEMMQHRTNVHRQGAPNQRQIQMQPQMQPQPQQQSQFQMINTMRNQQQQQHGRGGHSRSDHSMSSGGGSQRRQNSQPRNNSRGLSFPGRGYFGRHGFF